MDLVPKLVSEQLISGGKGPMEQDCMLGFNYKEELNFRTNYIVQPTMKLVLEGIKVTNITYHIFIEYSYFLSKSSDSNLQDGDISKSITIKIISEIASILTHKHHYPQVEWNRPSIIASHYFSPPLLLPTLQFAALILLLGCLVDNHWGLNQAL